MPDHDSTRLPGGIWIPLVTPFKDGRLDTAALALLARRYQSAAVSGLVLFGSTGEGNLLNISEKVAAAETVQNAVPDFPMLFCAGAVDTRSLCTLIQRLDRLDPDGWLIPPPYYVNPSPAGIFWHYQEISWTSKRPVIIYDVPQRTGATLSVELVERLCQKTTCVAIKGCDRVKLSAMNHRNSIPTYCGDDLFFADHFTEGGVGAISAAAHIRPDIFSAVMTLAKAGQAENAQELFGRIKPLIKLLFSESNPSPLKALLAASGLIRNELRLPMTAASEPLAHKLDRMSLTLPGEEEIALKCRPSR